MSFFLEGKEGGGYRHLKCLYGNSLFLSFVMACFAKTKVTGAKIKVERVF